MNDKTTSKIEDFDPFSLDRQDEMDTRVAVVSIVNNHPAKPTKANGKAVKPHASLVTKPNLDTTKAVAKGEK